jgi:hypothetical protein
MWAVSQLREAGTNKIKRGTYSLPFEFVVPASSPASTQYPDSKRNFDCRIQYSLLARMGTIRSSRIVDIASTPLPNETVPCLVQPTTYQLKSFGVLKKGSITVGASVADSHIGRGQTLKISIASRNDASVNIERVRVKLMELIDYKAQEEGNVRKIELNMLNDIDLPCLIKARKSRSERRQSGRGGFEDNIEATYQEIYEDLVSGQNEVDLQIPYSARDTYSGKLMTISHYLKVTFFTTSLVENPSTKIPIRIGNPSERRGSQPSVPSAPIATAVTEDHIHESRNANDEPEIEVDIPMVNAVLLDRHNNNVPERASSPRGVSDAVVVGAAAVFLEANQDDESNSESIKDDSDESNSDESDYPTGMHTDSDNLENLPPATNEMQATPSLIMLFQEMKDTTNGHEVVCAKMRSPEWLDIFARLTSDEFGIILSKIKMDHQIRVAALLAKRVPTNRFTCAHCVAALRQTSEHFRSNMVEALLRYCCDLETEHSLIQDCLSEWEQVITARAFEDAIHRRRSRR